MWIVKENKFLLKMRKKNVNLRSSQDSFPFLFHINLKINNDEKESKCGKSWGRDRNRLQFFFVSPHIIKKKERQTRRSSSFHYEKRNQMIAGVLSSFLYYGLTLWAHILKNQLLSYAWWHIWKKAIGEPKGRRFPILALRFPLINYIFLKKINCN